jgi:DHA1 family bicyclomycin/chloramphenicol resistance-like MFS transporter
MPLQYLPWLIGTIIAISEMSTDLLVPGLPLISHYFNINDSETALIVSANLIGLATSGLIYGPLSDYYGRRRILIIGYTIFCIATIICSFSLTFSHLILFRLIQGLGAGAAMVVGLGTIRDRYQGSECARRITQIEMVITFSPGVAPIIGSFLVALISWRASFWFMALFACIGLGIILRYFPETNEKTHRHSFAISSIAKIYFHLLKRPKYIGYGLINVLCVAWVWSEYAIIPFVYLETYHVPIQYFGYFIFLNLLAYFFGTVTNQIFVSKHGIRRLLFIGICIVLVDTLFFGIMVHYYSPPVILISLIKLPAQFGAALIVGNAMTKALENAGNESGSGTALITCSQFLFGALYINLSSQYINGTLWPLIFCMAMSSILSFVAYYLTRYKSLNQNH